MVPMSKSATTFSVQQISFLGNGFMLNNIFMLFFSYLRQFLCWQILFIKQHPHNYNYNQILDFKSRTNEEKYSVRLEFHAEILLRIKLIDRSNANVSLLEPVRYMCTFFSFYRPFKIKTHLDGHCYYEHVSGISLKII